MENKNKSLTKRKSSVGNKFSAEIKARGSVKNSEYKVNKSGK